MARDMFYNYEHHLNRKEYPEEDVVESIKKLNSYADMQIIYNIKGDFIGVSTKQGNPIKLYFSFSGDIDDDIDVISYLNDFSFKIVNVLHEPLITEANASITPTHNFNEIEVYIPAEANTLKKDIYRMELSCNIDGENYTLFSEQDAILEII